MSIFLIFDGSRGNCIIIIGVPALFDLIITHYDPITNTDMNNKVSDLVDPILRDTQTCTKKIEDHEKISNITIEINEMKQRFNNLRGETTKLQKEIDDYLMKHEKFLEENKFCEDRSTCNVL